MISTLLVLLIVLAIGWTYLEKRIKNFPPGPIGLPLLGHLPLLGKYPWKTLWQWRTTYGPVIGIWFGSYRTIVINDARLIREAMNMNAFAGRPKLSIFTSRSNDGIPRGVASTDGSQWIEQRRFIIKHLKDFGSETKSTEAKIQHEVYELLKCLRAREGQPIQVKGYFATAALNTLWSIIFSSTLNHDDPDSLKAIRGLISILDQPDSATLSFFVPWIAKIFPRMSGFETILKSFAIVTSFLRKQIAMHNLNYVDNQPRDFVDAFTDKVHTTTDLSSSFHAGNDVMIQTLMDMFGGGAETTSNILSWLCAYVIHHPQVQRKLQNEIDDIIGRNRVPNLTDRSFMPYTEAVINEVMRVSSILPLGLFHNATEDVEFHGFFVPKDTMIIPNLYGIHFDKAIWGDPENFRPERFINANGKFMKNENVLPFSTGKRMCVGAGLGMDELFVYYKLVSNVFYVGIWRLTEFRTSFGIGISAAAI